MAPARAAGEGITEAAPESTGAARSATDGATGADGTGTGGTTAADTGADATAGTGRRGSRPGAGARPTLEQVAALAGVGRGTASRVVNGSPRVSDHTRAAVEAAVAELGYVPNRAARALAAGSADAVALVVPESEARFFAEPYFSGVLRGISHEVTDSDMQLLLTLVRDASERDRFAQYAAAHRVDGVLLVSVRTDDSLPDTLEQLGMPTVLGGRRSAHESLAYVDADNLAGARAAVAYLIARGRRTVATITGPMDVYAAQCRLSGYHEALRAAGVDSDDERLVAYADFTEEGGHRAMRELLLRSPALDAVFCASDVMASGARVALREAGRSVPEDVALAGFDDSATARHMDPPLTTVRQPLEQMGRAMARVLLDRIAEPKSTSSLATRPGRAQPRTAQPDAAQPGAAPAGAAVARSGQIRAGRGGTRQPQMVLPTQLICRRST